MAGRKDKNTVDYFPHYCNNGKTIFILENKYGNDGYAVWFKLLELLGSSENHYYDCRNIEEWEYLQAKMKISDETLKNILDTLSSLNAINKLMWENKIIWSDNFIKNIEDVYERRKTSCMNLYDLCKHLSIKCKHKLIDSDINENENTQSKGKDTKVKDSIPPKIEDVKKYCEERNNNVDTNKWYNHYQSKGWMIGKNKMKDWRAAVRTWENSDVKPEKIITDSRTLYPEWKKTQS